MGSRRVNGKNVKEILENEILDFVKLDKFYAKNDTITLNSIHSRLKISVTTLLNPIKNI